MKKTSIDCFLSSPEPSVKHSTYFSVYDHLFEKFRDKPITFVEVGVLGGGSLFMWRDFFGPQARIIGIDLNPAAKKWEATGFEIFIGDQADPNFWKGVSSQIGPIDILLDDGGHTFLQQVTTAQATLDLIVDGGLFVVEDTHTSYMEGFGPRKYSFMNFAFKYMDTLNHRFHGLAGSGKQQGATPVWSMEVFESIVAFRVDRNKSQATSLETFNRSDTERKSLPADFRYHIERKGRLRKKFSSLNLVRLRSMFIFLERAFQSDTPKLKKLFKDLD